MGETGVINICTLSLYKQEQRDNLNFVQETGVLGTKLYRCVFDKKEVRPIKTKLHMHMVAT